MKTKKILLPGMMAALAFAACTNEEIVTMPNATPEVDLSNRPLVGQVDLNFGPQSATRLAQGDDAFNQVVWENGDKIGARIIDAPNGLNYKDPFKRYNAVDGYASSNYEYTKGETDGVWRTEALLVEGNYMFYAPYNPSQGREPLVLNFPHNQKINKIETAKVNEDAIMNFFGNEQNQTVLVGHTFLRATGDTKVTPFMEHLYAYPQISLQNAEEFYALNGNDTIAKELKISKIIIEDKDGQIKDKYQIQHSLLISKMKNAVEAYTGRDYVSHSAEAAGDWRTPLGLLNSKTSDILASSAGSTVANKKVVINLNEVYTAANDEIIRFHAVLPAVQYKEDQLTVNVVFKDKNGVEWIFVDGVSFNLTDATADETMTLAPGKRFPREEYDFSTSYEKGYATKPAAGELATFQIKSGQAIKYKADAPVVNIQNAKEFGEWLASNVKNNTVTVTEGEDFVLEAYKGFASNSSDAYKNGKPMMWFSEEVIEVVNKYLDKGTVVFNSQMLVEEDLAPSADRFEFNGGIYQTAGTLTLKDFEFNAASTFNGNAIIDGGKYGDLTFAAGKTVTFKNSVKATTVTLKNGASALGALTADVTNINGGKVEVPANFAGNLGNVNVKNATLTLKKAITNNIVLGTVGTGTNSGRYYDKATLNVDANDFSFVNVTANKADINLNANTTMSQTFVGSWKDGAITNAAEKTLTLSDAVTIPAKTDADKKYTRTFTNNGKVSGTLNIAADAEVTNNYELAVNENNGKIITGQDSRTYVTSGAGEVDNSSLSYVKNDANQTVSATFASSKSVEEIESAGPGLRYINKLVFANGLVLDRAFDSDLLNGVRAIEIKGGDVVVKTFATTAATTLDITGNVMFRGTLDRENTGFGFKNGAAINVASGKTLTVAYMTMGTLSSTKGLEIDGNVLVKDANLYIGLGFAPQSSVELGGVILNSWVNVTDKSVNTVKAGALIAAVNRGDAKIKIFDDVTLDETLEISADCEFNLNGKQLASISGDVIVINSGKTLTIGGDGTVKAVAEGAEVIKNLGGKLIINNGTYSAEGSGNSAAIVCDANGGSTWNLTINGGTFKSSYFTAVSLQNNRGVEGSTMVDGLANISGGTFNGNLYDLYMANVKANVAEDCTFENDKVYILTTYDGKNYNSIINGYLVTPTEIDGLMKVEDGVVDWESIIPKAN